MALSPAVLRVRFCFDVGGPCATWRQRRCRRGSILGGLCSIGLNVVKWRACLAAHAVHAFHASLAPLPMFNSIEPAIVDLLAQSLPLRFVRSSASANAVPCANTTQRNNIDK